MERYPVTAEGFARMEVELKELKTVERPAVIKAIGEAREHGDLKENAEYHAAREKQGFIEARLKDLEARISRAEVVDVKALTGNTVKFGATVTLADEDTDAEVTYQIVGEYEADLKINKISCTAPIARALMGKELGDTVEVPAPKGAKRYEILKVSFG